jgi:hypothetical protein
MSRRARILCSCVAMLWAGRQAAAWTDSHIGALSMPHDLSRSISPSGQFAQPPAQRQPRRKLQKRRRRRDKQQGGFFDDSDDDEQWESAELRPLVLSRSKELGEDYWIDEKDLQRERQRMASRPPDPGQIPEQKLWKEVLSPYRQNWIGLISVVFVVLATIITKFPELLSTPSITIPDL